MSKLRPTTVCDPYSTKYSPPLPELYLAVLKAVQHQPGLIHGKLDDAKGAHCALGSYWDDHPNWAIKSDQVDVIAGVNDSVPTVSAKRRKELVIQWLKWKLRCFGYNYRAEKPRTRRKKS